MAPDWNLERVRFPPELPSADEMIEFFEKRPDVQAREELGGF